MTLKKFDLSAYLVIGPENTLGRPLEDLVLAALDAGFTCIQIRSKVASAKELIGHTLKVSAVIQAHPRREEICLLVNDRLDVVLAARQAGGVVDGVHVGQDDIPPEVCRAYLGQEAVIGLSTNPEELIQALEKGAKEIDYFGVGPWHPSETKKDCGQDLDGQVRTISPEVMTVLCQRSPLPIVVGGGVKLADLKSIAKTGADGFFVVSAFASAPDPAQAGCDLVTRWRAQKGDDK